MKNELYNKLIDAFLENIPKSSKQKLGEAYRAFLELEYDRHFQESMDERDFDKAAQFCIKKEKVIHISKSPTEKEAFLFPDSAYQEFEAFSFNVFEMAKIFLETHKTISVTEYSELTQKCSELFDRVSTLYRGTAERLYSETSLEINLISGNSNNTSFRLNGYLSAE